MNLISRRAALGRIATIPAMGIATGAAFAAGAAVADPDAELLAIGAEFDRKNAALKPLWWEQERLFDEQEARDPRPQIAARSEGEADIWRAWCKRHFDFTGQPETEAAVAAVNGLNEEMDAIIQRIRAISPQTLPGLLVWAKAMAWDCMNPEQAECPLIEADYDNEHVRRFVTELERLAGKAVG